MKLKFMTVKPMLAALIFGAATASASSAATVNGTCESGNKFVSLFAVEANDANNVYCEPGFPSYSASSGTVELAAFSDTFTLAYKSVGGVGSTQGGGDGAYSFSSFTSGTWALNVAPTDTLKFIVGIKEGTTYAGFLVNVQAGTWFTANSSTSTAGTSISHYDLWYAGSTPAPVPLPAAAWMLLAGLGGLFATRKK